MYKKLFFSILCVLLVFVSCKQEQVVQVDSKSESLEKKKGLLYRKGKLFSGELVSFFSNEQQSLKCSYRKGKKQGVEKIWYPNKQLATLREYNAGVKVGIHKGWWENGNQKFEFQFNNFGEYSGKLKEWYSNGELYRAFTYVRGSEEGSQKMWKPNGNIKANYVVVNGERFGLIGLKKCTSVATN